MPTTTEVSFEEKTDTTTLTTETTYTHESFSGYAQTPGNAGNIEKTLVDGKYTTRWTIRIKSGNTGSTPTYTIQGGMEQQPLATHPMFKAGAYAVTDEEWKKWKLYESDNTDVTLGGWKPDAESSSSGMKKFYAYYNRGVVDFLLGTCTMREESESGSPSLSGLGRIDSPQGAPGLGEGRNWLLVGIDATPIEGFGTLNGPLMKVVREFRASAAGGWDAEIYNNA